MLQVILSCKMFSTFSNLLKIGHCVVNTNSPRKFHKNMKMKRLGESSVNTSRVVILKINLIYFRQVSNYDPPMQNDETLKINSLDSK